MSNRELLKGIQPLEMPEIYWRFDDDLPVTFSEEEKKAMQFKVIKQNYKRGAISKEMYSKMMASVRNS